MSALRGLLFGFMLSSAVVAKAGILKGQAYVDLNKNYQLTNGTDKSLGGIWSDNSLDLNADFNISFEIKFNNSTANEGFAFLLLPNNQRPLGAPGPGLGIAGIDTSLAVEFDVRNNTEFDDSHNPGDHIALRVNGKFDEASNLSKNIPVKNIADGNFHHIRIRYNAMFKQVEVYIDQKKITTVYCDMRKDVFHGQQQVYWGLTAAGAMGKSIITARNFSQPMEVYMMFLTAEKSGNDKVVRWATAYENISEKFEIYRSNDGVVWGLAAVMPCAGPSEQVTVYSFTDVGYGDSDVVYLMRRVELTGADQYIPVTMIIPDGDIKAHILVEEEEKKENDSTEASYNFYDPVGRHIYYGTVTEFMKRCEAGLVYFADNRQKYVKF